MILIWLLIIKIDINTQKHVLQVGLIDEIANDKDEAITKCKNFIKKFDNVSPYCRKLSKERIREGVVKKFEDRRELDLVEYLEFVKNPDIQKNMEKYMEKLKKKNVIKN